MTAIKGTFEFLGTGASMGVPVIGCDCAVCQSPSLFNKRLRPSALLTIGAKRILIDCGPDFKQQALRVNLKSLDGVIFTHAHNDHIAGIDDLRTLCKQPGKLPCLLSKESASDIQKRFYYVFNDEMIPGKWVTQFDMHFLDSHDGQLSFQDVPIHYVTYSQMGMPVNGFRFGDLAYITDIRDYSDTIFETLEGVHTLVVSALRFTPSPMHFSIDEAVDFAKRTKAKEIYLTHISHDLDHEKTNAYLPKEVRLAYDGLRLNLLT